MLLILSTLIAITHSATLASIEFPEWGAPIFDPTLTSHTCYSCLRSHHNWIFDSARYYIVEATGVTSADLITQGCC